MTTTAGWVEARTDGQAVTHITGRWVLVHLDTAPEGPGWYLYGPDTPGERMDPADLSPALDLLLATRIADVSLSTLGGPMRHPNPIPWLIDPGQVLATAARTTPQWPTDTSTPIPADLFSSDHWTTFLYVEERAVNHHGLLNHNQLRCHKLRHPVFYSYKVHAASPHADGARYPTRIKDPSTSPPARVEVADHDDYDCLTDLAAAGLVTVAMPEVGPDGVYVDAAGRAVETTTGHTILPGFVTGYAELVLAAHASWRLTDLGAVVAGQLRYHRAGGGLTHRFVPDLNVAPAALSPDVRHTPGGTR